MADTRFNRWQAYSITQLTFAINLVFGLSVGALGFAVSLLRDISFIPSRCYSILFAASLALLGISTLCGIGAVVSRLLDFRYTARKIRHVEESTDGEDAHRLEALTDTLGKATWRLFWALLTLFILGIAGLLVSVFSVYGNRLFQQ